MSVGACASVTKQTDPHAPDAIVVRASKAWNDTQRDVGAGETLSFEVVGKLRDMQISSTAAGYDKAYMRPFSGLRRVKTARWFELVGCVGKSLDHCWVISDGREEVTMTVPGRLYLFVNDAGWFYWNNAGVLFVRVSSAEPPSQTSAASAPLPVRGNPPSGAPGSNPKRPG